ncbi:hypothetical protein FIBSPDRAFT_891034 [Athelia psychrophila]|uniref:Uncharacterized protein n=1 Tax=Athelia psychrophila TaxID=1759441 RepID=A0A166K5N6_9AGAM|nr:hypothetical protein FIBSPDRAFT_891034 [Fibularhizoctonia sp. CBS 109695]
MIRTFCKSDGRRIEVTPNRSRTLTMYAVGLRIWARDQACQGLSGPVNGSIEERGSYREGSFDWSFKIRHYRARKQAKRPFARTKSEQRRSMQRAKFSQQAWPQSYYQIMPLTSSKIVSGKWVGRGMGEDGAWWTETWLREGGRRPKAVISIEMSPHLEIGVAEVQPLSFATLSPFLTAILRFPVSSGKIYRHDKILAIYL